MFKVRYIAGAGVELAVPLSDGRTSFTSGIDHEIENVVDFIRLVTSGSFEAVEFDETLIDAEKFKKGLIIGKTAEVKAPVVPEKPNKVEDSANTKETNV